MPSLCYMTPSYAADLERFAILRRSIRLFSPDIPHFAYVDAEDVPAFRRRFGGEPGLEILSKAELLPPALEARRRFRKGWRGRLAERVAWRLRLPVREADGWKLQQIAKLNATARLPYDATVFLDSDVFLCGPVTPGTFVAEGRLRLRETRAETYEDFAFEVSRQILFRRGLRERAEAFNYVHVAPRFLRRTAARLIGHLEAIHEDWAEALLRAPAPSEFDLLGHVLREMEGYEGTVPEGTPPAAWSYEVKDPGDLEARIAECRREGGRRVFFQVQSNMGMPADRYGPAVVSMMEEIAARGAERTPEAAIGS